MFAVFDIAIDKLRIRAAKKDAALIATDMQNGGWSTGDPREWVFIRKLSVSSPKNSIRLNASRQIKHEFSRGVHCSSTVADTANAVHFASLAEVIAFLLRDISLGRHGLWYWKKWEHLFYLPKSEALTHILWDNINDVAAIFEKLADMDVLPEVWRQITVSHAEILVARLAAIQNLSLQTLVCRDPEQPPNENLSDIQRIFSGREKIISRWRKALPVAPERDAKFYLAAAVVGLTLAPQALIQRPGQIVAAFSHCLSGPAVLLEENRQEHQAGSARRDGIVDTTASKRLGSAIELHDEENIQAKPGRAKKKNTKSQGETIALPEPGRESTAHISPSEIFPPESSIRIDEAAHRPAQGKPVFDRDAPSDMSGEPGESYSVGTMSGGQFNHLCTEDRAEYQFYSEFGGAFYLINAINHPDSHAMLRENSEWMEMISGWTLIHSLAKNICAELDRPLVRFFADVAALPSADQLAQFPHTDLVDLLLPRFRLRYAHKLPIDLSLLSIPARVTVSYSRVDVDYDSSSIRLPVRLCGLDVNPGWIPWLGRVVRFHYLDDAPLKVGGGK